MREKAPPRRGGRRDRAAPMLSAAVPPRSHRPVQPRYYPPRVANRPDGPSFKAGMRVSIIGTPVDVETQAMLFNAVPLLSSAVLARGLPAPALDRDLALRGDGVVVASAARRAKPARLRSAATLVAPPAALSQRACSTPSDAGRAIAKRARSTSSPSASRTLEPRRTVAPRSSDERTRLAAARRALARVAARKGPTSGLLGKRSISPARRRASAPPSRGTRPSRSSTSSSPPSSISG